MNSDDINSPRPHNEYFETSGDEDDDKEFRKAEMRMMAAYETKF